MSGPVDDGGELELGAHLRPGGPVMTARPRATEVSNLKKHRRSARIDARRADKMKKAKVLGTVRRTFEKETLKLRELEAEHKELENARFELEDVAGGSRILPKAQLEALTEAEKKETDAQDKVRMQTEVVRDQQLLLDHAQKEYDRADLLVHKDLPAATDLANDAALEQAENRALATLLKAQEEAAAERLAQRAERRAKKQADAADAARTDAARQREQALAGARGAAKRVAQTGKVRKAAEAEIARQTQQEWEDRTAAVLELKANTDAAMDELKGANHKQATERRALDAANKAEFDELLAQGENPYEVFRKRVEDTRVEKRKKRRHKSMLKEKDRLAKNMIVEDQRERRKEQRAKADAEAEHLYQMQQGRTYSEKMTTAYLKSTTRGGVDMVDPTGRSLRIDPSQVTVIKDKTFGLGFSNRDGDTVEDRLLVVDKVARRPQNKGVTYDPRLVPRPKKFAEAADDDAAPTDGESLLPPDLPTPGADLHFNTGGEDTSSGAGEQTGQEQSVATGSAVAKKFPKPQPTKLEQKYMAMARQRQRNNIVHKQVVWGKEFTSVPFISEPAEILFKDFTVGKTEKRRIVLTNVSYSFNTFKLNPEPNPLPDEVKDFFEIEYKKPGRMSAGMTCAIDITFSPKVNNDIITDLPCLAQTGPFAVPLRCLIKRAVPSVNTEVVKFENVVMGESSTFGLVIKNGGALPLHCTLVDESGDINAFVPEDDGHDVPRHAKDENDLFTIARSVTKAAEAERKGQPVTFKSNCVVKPYSQSVVKVTFKPHDVGHLEVPVRLIFEEPNCPDIPVLIQCHAVPVPIFVEPPILDFRCCAYEKLYRAKILLRNRGPVALKMMANVPDELQDGALEFNPTLGFVQGKSHDAAGNENDGNFEVQIKFRPPAGLLKRCRRHGYASEGTKEGEAAGIIAVPVRIDITDQVLPVYFTLRAQLTTSEIRFETPVTELDVTGQLGNDAAWGRFDGDFGSCYTTQSATIPVRMTNLSALPQQFGYVKLPRELSVEPEDGFGMMLPGETVMRNLIFSPYSATQHSLRATCRTTMNRTFSLPCTGLGVTPPLRLSHTVLTFGATSVKDRVVQSAFVKNTSSEAQTFEWAVPQAQSSSLKVSPNVATVAAGKTIRVQFEFYPPEAPVVSAEAFTPIGAAADAAAAEQTEGEQANSVDEADDGNTDLAGHADGNDNVSEDADTSEGGPLLEQDPAVNEVVAGHDTSTTDGLSLASGFGNVQLSQTRTVAAVSSGPGGEDGAPALKAEPPSVHAIWKVPCFVKSDPKQPLFVEVRWTHVEREFTVDKDNIDFGQLAVGKSTIVNLRVRNASDRGVSLRMQGLNPVGAYSIINAVRPIAPNAYQDLQVKFEPPRQLHFCETLLLFSDTGKASITLSGQGVSPVLTVDPEDGVLDLGHICAGETATGTVTLHNSSVFPLTYVIRPKREQHANFSNVDTFSCVPLEATIEPGDKQVVTVRFAGDHERPEQYIETFTIDVPNQEQEHILTLKGWAWARQAFVVPSLNDALDRSAPERVENAFALPPALAEANATEALAATAPSAPAARQINRLIRLKFPRTASASNPSTKEILVGCTQVGKDRKGGNAAYEVELTGDFADQFACSAPKGSAAAGQTTSVGFTFAPEPPQERAGPKGIDAGHWVECKAVVTVKGGYVPAEGADDTQIFNVILLGWLSR